MASNPPSACCANGFKHEGTPVGELKNIEGVNTYISTPKNNKKPDTAILYLTDIFGIFPNNQLLSDEFANNGYLTVLPDLFNGGQLGVDDMSSGKVNIMEWLKDYQPAQVDPIVAATIKYMRETLGVKRIAAVGYCFGARYVTRFLKDGQINVGYHAHPTGTTHEDLAAIQGPLSISAAEIDSAFPAKLRHESEEILAKTGQEWQINLFSGVVHGFAVRADLSDSKQKWAKEQAFCQAVTWFNRHL
ncbi:Dienelactone hydrolase [Penicillium verhagenii]|uniref:Dienelactone hydrolase n=1 Tax=Penicillium verhagenii TaxID=1562060 RepID=UPI002544D421|nr:Dienelactone hydrolase [Penicillium verhagenii]KAJ5935030.1 Dienelactone hydrolase [Penicillium verhagenii]